ncbi:lysozyme inhibitor LprI family protein [Azospirillum sp. B510]|uniref:lysozyme inhibitor LprI family protein n=1 Tax=Azospirillum sp. (strain B510) TaxID=137722 RepID=UPI0005AADC76|nr:lysozyme inhibitor LprI family protein [Azospirillum sp. B510]
MDKRNKRTSSIAGAAGGAMLAGAALTISMMVAGIVGAGTARAEPSFDCKAASTPVEKAICADPKLGDADKEIADSYKALQDLSGAADRDRLRAEQRAWLGQRNQCATASSPGACLGPILDARRTALSESMPKAVAAFTAIVDGIAGDPAGAAKRLAEIRGGLGKGWSAYLLRFGPSPDRAKAEGLLREAVAGIDDSFARETAAGVDIATDEGFLTALRVVSDELAMAWPCSVMERRGAAAWKAMEPLYGSNRDNFGAEPACPDDKALLGAPVWKSVEDQLAPMMEAASNRTGTIRFATYRQMGIDRVKSAVDPRLFLAGAPNLADLLKTTAGWSNPRWIAAGWSDGLRKAVDAAVAAWTPQIAARYGIATTEARRVAEAVAAQGLNGGIGLITDNLELQKDTRLPDWLRGGWSWSGGGAGDAPFDAPAGKARIDAASICVGKECSGYDVAGQGEDAGFDPKEAPKDVKLAANAAQQAVSLAPVSAGGSLTVVPLAGGNLLVTGTAKPMVLKRDGK